MHKEYLLSLNQFKIPVESKQGLSLPNLLLSNCYQYKLKTFGLRNQKLYLKYKLPILKAIPYLKRRLKENDRVITTEFYNFWFRQLRKHWWVHRTENINSKRKVAAAKWQVFRFARYSKKARSWRNSVSFNWTKALQAKEQMQVKQQSVFLGIKNFALANSLKKYLYILNTQSLLNKDNLIKVQNRITQIKKKNKIIQALFKNLVLKSFSLERKRTNLYYDIYSKFNTSLRNPSLNITEKLRLVRAANFVNKRQIAWKLYWPVLHNKFPNFLTTARFVWFKKQLKKFLNYRYSRYNKMYKFFLGPKLRELLRPNWINWKLTKKFRGLRRWRRRNFLVNSSLTKNDLGQLLIFYSHRHLRLLSPRRKSYSLIINITVRNFFINIVRSKSGSPVKVISGGTLKAKTRRLRRSIAIFIKAFMLAIKFLKVRNITKLKFIKISQDSQNPYLRITTKNIHFMMKLLKNNNLKRIKRWMINTNNIHGLPPRGPKLRRK